MNMPDDKITVSVILITYNHEEYIAQAIESVLNQKVNFKYEVIIGDDNSLDNTQQIIKEYELLYPEKIKAILRKQNIGMRKNSDDLRQRAQGKYIIALEGDDYWIDNNKLEKQVEFLEKNIEFVAVAHWCDVVDQCGKSSNLYPNKKEIFNFKKDIYKLRDYKNDIIPGHINTIMYRNIYLDNKYNLNKFYSASETIGDRTTYLMLVLIGKVGVIHEVMSCYRFIQRQGATNYCSTIIGKNIALDRYLYYSKLEKYSKDVFNKNIKLTKLRYDMVLRAISAVRKNNTEENTVILKEILNDLNKIEISIYIPFFAVKSLLHKSYKILKLKLIGGN